MKSVQSRASCLSVEGRLPTHLPTRSYSEGVRCRLHPARPPATPSAWKGQKLCTMRLKTERRNDERQKDYDKSELALALIVAAVMTDQAGGLSCSLESGPYRIGWLTHCGQIPNGAEIIQTERMSRNSFGQAPSAFATWSLRLESNQRPAVYEIRESNLRQPNPTRNHKGGGAGMGLDGPALSCPGGRKRLVQLGSELSCTIIRSTRVRK